MADYDFPDDLRDAQLRLHQATAAYRALCRTLPWSVDPAPGREGEKQPYTDYRTGKPASPGYTEQQKADETRLRRELLELAVAVTTHTHWTTVEYGSVADARMALKHIHDKDPATTNAHDARS